MRKMLAAMLAVTLVFSTAGRSDEMDEKDKDKEPPKEEKKKEEKKKEEPKGKKGEAKKEAGGTVMDLPVRGLSETNAEKALGELKKLSGIAEATPDAKKKTIQVRYGSQAGSGLAALNQALGKVGMGIDLERFTLKYPCKIALAGPMTGAVFDPKMGKRSGFNSLAGQRLLADLKQIEGVRFAQWADPQTLRLGCDRDVKYGAVSGLIAKHGSTGGSGVIKDVTWEAEKAEPAGGKGKGKGGPPKK